MAFDNLLALSKYKLVASWAVWRNDGTQQKDTQVIIDNLADLHTRVVLVGLNAAGKAREAWGSFRGGKFDRRLRYAFNESPYRGAYMTDIIKDHVEKIASKIMRQTKGGTIDIPRQIERFRLEMNDVGASSDSLFILFGNDVDSIFRSGLTDVFPNFVKVQHYSYFSHTDAAWVENTWLTLEDHYRATAKTLNTPPFVRTDRMNTQLKSLRERSLRE